MKQTSALAKTSPSAEFAIPVRVSLLDELREAVPAHIRRVNTGFFVISSPLGLKAEKLVEVKFGDRRLECQVVYCQPDGPDKFNLGVRITQSGEALRTEPRIPVDLEAKLTLAGAEAPIFCRVVNISASGLGLLLNTEVPTDEMAYAELEIGTAFGEIRHCSKTASGYRVGLKLDEFISKGDEILAARKRSAPTQQPTGFGRLFRKSN